MQQQLTELVTLLSSGALEDEDVTTIVNQVLAAAEDGEGFLAANPDIYYEDDFPLPLWEWVLVNELPLEVLFVAPSLDELYPQLLEAFGEDTEAGLTVEQIMACDDALQALELIQAQLAQFNAENGGYILVDFSQSLTDEMMVAMVYRNDLPRLQELCDELGIYIAPSDDALRELLEGDGDQE